MKVALALVLALVGCKGSEKEPPVRMQPPQPTPVADAGLIGSQLKLLGCSAALAAPGIPGYGQIGKAGGVRPNEGFGVNQMRTGGGGPATPQVRLGKLTVGGPISKDKVSTTIAKHKNRLQFCYEQSLVKQPLTGSVVLTATLLETGQVFEAHVENSIDDELSLCLKHIISELKFPDSGKQAVSRTSVKLPLTFAWQPVVPATPAPEPKAWTPFAASSARAPLTVGAPAAANFPPALSLGKLEKCLGTRNGSFRAIVKIATDGSVIGARTGGLGDKETESCLSSALVGTKGTPVDLITEVACDFQRGDATPWRVSVDAGYTVIEPAAGKDDYVTAPGDGERTFLVVLDPTTPADVVAKTLAIASQGAASIVALRVDAGAPLYVGAGPHVATTPDPSSPMTLDTRDPITVCGGLLDEPKSGAFNDADKVLGAAARRCTHRPCPSMLTISLAGTRTARDLAALAGAARGLDFERVGFGPATCPRK